MGLGLALGLGVCAPAALGFTPASLSGLALWLRADLGITVTGSGVSLWADQSGNGRNFAQGTDAQRPPYLASGGINGKASLHGTAVSGQGLVCVATMATILGPATAAERFAVGKLAADGDIDPIGINWGTGDSGSYFEFIDSKPYDGFATTIRSTGNAIPAGVMTQPFVTDTQSTNGLFSILINGTTNFTTGTNTFNAGATTPGLMNAGAGSMNGLLGEVIVYSRILSAGERSQIRAYLTAFWGTP